MSFIGGHWQTERRLDPSELRIGHFVTELDIPWSETDFPLQGVLIDDFRKKKWLVEHCSWVKVSEVRVPDGVRPARSTRTPSRPLARAKPSGFRIVPSGEVSRETLERALEVYDVLDCQVHDLAERFARKGRIDIQAAGDVIRELTDVLEHHMAALVWLTRIKERDDYTARHCINVSILSIGLGHALDWEKQQIERAGLAGLLHDLGKMQVDQAVLNKPGALTADEFDEVKRHTEFGYELLRREGNLPEAVAEAVHCHHERPDGSGYPRGLKLPQIPALARLVAIVDAYDAITSERVYDAARSHHEAFGILWKERNRQFDGPMVEMFTQFLGWVTPGTLVRLSNDRLAVVLQAREGRGLLPLVRLLEREGDGMVLGESLDLARYRPPVGDAPVRVDEVLPDGSHGINVRDLTLNF